MPLGLRLPACLLVAPCLLLSLMIRSRRFEFIGADGLDYLFEERKKAKEVRWAMGNEQDEEKITKEDYAAPGGKFRLIGDDKFVWPPEEYVIGDYDHKEQAFEEADNRRQPGTIVRVYKDKGVRQRR